MTKDEKFKWMCSVADEIDSHRYHMACESDISQEDFLKIIMDIIKSGRGQDHE